MADLKKVGYWKGPYHQDDDYPDVQECVDRKWDEADRSMVLRYLASFPLRKMYRGWSKCRFCDKRNGSSDHSDGVWVWPSGLAHYVSRHSVRLPEEFVAHVRANHIEGDEL